MISRGFLFSGNSRIDRSDKDRTEDRAAGAGIAPEGLNHPWWESAGIFPNGPRWRGKRPVPQPRV